MSPKKLLKKLVTKPEVTGLIEQITSLTGQSVNIRDVKGRNLLAESAMAAADDHVIEIDGLVVGYVTGQAEAKVIASLLAYLVREETERRDLAQEVLDKYREINLLHNLSERVEADLDVDGVAELFLDEAHALIASTDGAFLLLEDEGRMLKVEASFGQYYPNNSFISREVGLVGQLLVEDRPQILNNLTVNPADIPAPAQVVGLVFAPLRTKQGVIGAILLSNSEPQEYRAADLMLLNILASQAAPAIERAMLYETLEEKVRQRTAELRYRALQLETSAAVGQDITSILENQEYLLNRVAELIKEKFNYQYVGILLYDETGENLTVQAGTGDISQRLRQLSVPAKDSAGVIPWVANHGEPRLVRDGEPEDDRYVYLDVIPDSKVELVLPLRMGNRRLGVLNIQSGEENAFRDEDVHLFQSLADQVAIAIRNAQLFKDTVDKQSRLQAMIESSRDGIVLVEADLRISVINQPALTFLGLEGHPRHWTGRNLLEIMQKLRHRSRTTVQTVFNEIRGADLSEEGRNGEIEISNRHIRWVSLPVFAKEILLGRLIALRDVTEERLLESMREDLTRTMVHDLRNPLSNIFTSLQVVIDDVVDEGGSDPNPMLDIALRNAERMLKLLNNILDVNRLESNSMPINYSAVNMPGLVTEIFQTQSSIASQKKLTLDNAIASELPTAWADVALIERVLQNLVDNAIKFTPPEGTIRVSAHMAHTNGARRMQVCVSDSGPGIPPDLQARLFQKFVTGRNRARGSGLGLAFCKLVVEAHEGNIWVESEPGHGTTFHFTLPVAS